MEDDLGVDLTAREKLMLQFGGSCFPFKAHVAVSVKNLPNPLRLARKAGQPVRFSVHSSVTHFLIMEHRFPKELPYPIRARGGSWRKIIT